MSLPSNGTAASPPGSPVSLPVTPGATRPHHPHTANRLGMARDPCTRGDLTARRHPAKWHPRTHPPTQSRSRAPSAPVMPLKASLSRWQPYHQPGWRTRLTKFGAFVKPAKTSPSSPRAFSRAANCRLRRSHAEECAMRMERVHTPAPDQHVSCGIECCYCSVPVVLLFLCDERVVPSFFSPRGGGDQWWEAEADSPARGRAREDR